MLLQKKNNIPVVGEIPRSDEIIRWEDQANGESREMRILRSVRNFLHWPGSYWKVKKRRRRIYEKEAYFATAEELARGGLEAIPPQMISGKHLIYSSPATLAFNSPGAEGFGVKRAGLAVPDSIMLIVAPGCCGRNTSLISSMPEYNDRFFY